MKYQLKLLLTVLWVMISVIASGTVEAGGVAHPYHVSLAEVNWNSKSQKFEVALCLWPADLEKALAQQTGRPIDLAKEPNVDRLIETYVAKRFKIHSTSRAAAKSREPSTELPVPIKDLESNKISGATKVSGDSQSTHGVQLIESATVAKLQTKPTSKSGKIEWYGHEADAKQVWLYFEVAADAEADWKVENRVFFELNDDQLNHVQWTSAGKTETLVCNSENPEISLPKK